MFGLCMFFYHNRIGQSLLGVELQKLVYLRKIHSALTQILPAKMYMKFVKRSKLVDQNLRVISLEINLWIGDAAVDT